MKRLYVFVIITVAGFSCKTAMQSSKQLNTFDSNKKKEGYYVEQDTLKVLTQTTMQIQHFDSNGKSISSTPQNNDNYEKLIYRKEGRYNDNGLRTGIWKYFSNGVLSKEIIYETGKISDAKIFDSKGNIKVSIKVDPLTDIATVTEFSMNGTIEKTFTLPSYLLHMEHSY